VEDQSELRKISPFKSLHCAASAGGLSSKYGISPDQALRSISSKAVLMSCPSHVGKASASCGTSPSADSTVVSRRKPTHSSNASGTARPSNNLPLRFFMLTRPGQPHGGGVYVDADAVHVNVNPGGERSRLPDSCCGNSCESCQRQVHRLIRFGDNRHIIKSARGPPDEELVCQSPRKRCRQ